MQLVGGSERIISPGQILIFDTALNDQSPDIGYNSLTGEFTVNTPGNYFVSWWVATNGSATTTDLWFSLEVNMSGVTTGATPIVTGQLNGSALVTVNATPASLTLVNTTPSFIALASTPIQANIVILQIA